MSILVSHGARPRPPAARQSLARAARLLFLFLFSATAASAQAGPPYPAQQSAGSDAMRQAKPAPAPPAGEDEESESGDDEGVRARPRAADPATVMRTALVYVRSLSAFVDGREVEDSLRKRKEFRAWGMAITRDEGQADLIIEIARKPLSRRFTFSVIEPRTMAVVTSGKTRSVLFGKKIPNKIAKKFANRLRAVRPF